MIRFAPREFKALYDESTIRVYQVSHDIVANEALSLGTFGSYFNCERLTWIKPSFLWAMYRSNWGSKKGQNRILAIDIQREGFDTICQEAVCTAFNKNLYPTIEEWKSSLTRSNARYQWDVARDAWGNPTKCLAVQIGIQSRLSKLYVDEWIVKIADYTEMAQQLRNLLDHGKPILDLLPKEHVYAPLHTTLQFFDRQTNTQGQLEQHHR